MKQLLIASMLIFLCFLRCKKDDNQVKVNTITKPQGKVVLPSGSSINVDDLVVFSLGKESSIKGGVYEKDTIHSVENPIEFVANSQGDPL